MSIRRRNRVFYSGRNTFQSVLQPTNDPATVTNDPAATVSVEWSCYPDSLCLIENPTTPTTLFNFVWDPDDYQNWAMYLTVTAKQGDRTLSHSEFMEFTLEKGSG